MQIFIKLNHFNIYLFVSKLLIKLNKTPFFMEVYYFTRVLIWGFEPQSSA